MMTGSCSSHITPQSTSTMHSGALSVDTLSRKKHLFITSYTTSAEYDPQPFDPAWAEVSTILGCLSYNYFWRHWSDTFPKLIIKSKDLDVCDACYIFRHYYKNLKK